MPTAKCNVIAVIHQDDYQAKISSAFIRSVDNNDPKVVTIAMNKMVKYRLHFDAHEKLIFWEDYHWFLIRDHSDAVHMADKGINQVKFLTGDYGFKLLNTIMSHINFKEGVDKEVPVGQQ